jgi:hypothetical protein
VATMTGLLMLLGLLVGLVILVAAPIVLAIALVVAVVKLVLSLLLLPFRILGWGLGLGLTTVGLLFKGLFLAGAVGLLLLFGLIPLIPLLLLGAGLYLLLRPSRARSAPA